MKKISHYSLERPQDKAKFGLSACPKLVTTRVTLHSSSPYDSHKASDCSNTQLPEKLPVLVLQLQMIESSTYAVTRSAHLHLNRKKPYEKLIL